MKRAAIAGLILLVAAPSLRAQSFCAAVTADTLVSPTVLGNGSPGSVTTADIQSALNAGGHIRFNVGSSPTTITVTATLVINRAVVLDGDGVVTLSGGGARRIISITNTNNQTYAITLQNISFANGNASPRGGAIYKASGGPWQAVSLKLVNTTFTSNAAMPTGQDDGGGALYATGMADVRIGNSTFTSNSGSNGGAVYSLGSKQVTIVDSTFSNNQATGTGGNPGNGGNAGALGVDGADRLLDVCRTRFLANTSNAYGSGFFSVMYDGTSRSRFEDTTFDGNRQLSSSQFAAGAYIQGGPFALERVSIVRNEANGYAGLFIGPGASGVIRNATFVGNVARQALGGAMAIDSSAAVSIVNSTIAGNVATAAFAGGISIGSPNQLRLTNVILANNTGGNRFVTWNIQNAASQDGGGNMQWPTSRPMGGGNETPATPTTTFADPLLAAALADNGGFVPTLALTSASPARDTAVSTAEVPTTDARGVARIGVPDRGGYELGGVSGDATGDRVGDVFGRQDGGQVRILRSLTTSFDSTQWTSGFVAYRYDVYYADVTGDGRADLIARSKDNGNVEVFRSTGTAFTYLAGSGPGGVWSYGWGTSYDLYFADVTGDGKADLVGRYAPDGDVFVFPSTGAGFTSSARWSYGWSSGYDLYLADVTGDGRADLVSRYFGPTAGLTGDIYVSPSTGTGFASPTRWTYGFSAGYDVYVADVTGDGRADLVARYYGPSAGLTGNVYVMVSTGSSFSWNGNFAPWTYGWGSTYDLLLRDATGDSRADIVGRHRGNGDVYVARSTGTTFMFLGTWATGLDTSYGLY